MGLVIRQSDLSSFSYCAMRQHYDRLGAQHGIEPRRLSGTLFGTVWHYAFMVLQQAFNEGRDDALQVAQGTFEHYWAADHIGEIAEGTITDWMRGHTWGGLLANGRSSLKGALEWMKRDERQGKVLLAVEQTFDIPIVVQGEAHTLHGTVDSLKLGFEAGMPFLSIDDAKTGKKPDHLQYAMQWTVYAYAALHAEFWEPFLHVPGFDQVQKMCADQGYALWSGEQGMPAVPRSGRWLAAQNGKFEVSNCGWRTSQHYARMKVAIREYIKAQRAGVHPLTTDTKKCQYCPWRDVCGQAPLPDYQEGIDD